jgi:hypothetical protein
VLDAIGQKRIRYVDTVPEMAERAQVRSVCPIELLENGELRCGELRAEIASGADEQFDAALNCRAGSVLRFSGCVC